MAFRQILFLLNAYEIQPRTASKANKIAHEKTKAEWESKYGVSNIAQLQKVKEKKAATCLKKFGVDNIRKSQVFKDEHRAKMKARHGKGSLPNRFGNKTRWWANQGPEVRAKYGKFLVEGTKRFWKSRTEEEKIAIIQKRLETRSKTLTYDSKPEKRVGEILEALGLKIKRQKWIRQKSYDIQILGTRILIEVHGDFFHANPTIYSAEAIIHGKTTAAEIWKRDEARIQIAKDYGYIPIVIWEAEITGKSDSAIAKTISTRINENNNG